MLRTGINFLQHCAGVDLVRISLLAAPKVPASLIQCLIRRRQILGLFQQVLDLLLSVQVLLVAGLRDHASILRMIRLS